jgi:hypothetical protein
VRAEEGVESARGSGLRGAQGVREHVSAEAARVRRLCADSGRGACKAVACSVQPVGAGSCGWRLETTVSERTGPVFRSAFHSKSWQLKVVGVPLRSIGPAAPPPWAALVRAPRMRVGGGGGRERGPASACAVETQSPYHNGIEGEGSPIAPDIQGLTPDPCAASHTTSHRISKLLE